MTDFAAAETDYLGELATRTTARAPATLSEVWNSEWQRSGLDTYFGLQQPLADSVDELEGAIAGAAGKSVNDYARDKGFNLGQPSSIDSRISMLGQLADTFDDETRKKIEPLKDARRRAADKAQAIERDAADVSAGTYGLSGVTTSFLAGTARQLVDPAVLAANIATAPIGGPLKGPLWKVLARQGAAGAAGQAAVEPIVEPEREKLGLEAGAGRAAENILQAGIGSAGLAGILRGGAAAARRLRGQAPEIDAGLVNPDRPIIASETADVASESPNAITPHPDDLTAAAHVAERDELIAAHAPPDLAPGVHSERVAAAGDAIEDGSLPPPIEVKPGRVWGRAAVAEENRTLAEFIAARGGISADDALIGDVKAIIGGDNKFVPGFGQLVRKGGKPLDEIREAAVEAGYIQDPARFENRPSESTINDLTDALDREVRGDKVYRAGFEPDAHPDPGEQRVLREQRRADLDEQFSTRMAELEITAVNKADRARTLQIMEKEGESDPLAAYERAIQERADANEARRAARQQIHEPVPGWDIPDDAGAAPPQRENAAGKIPERSGDVGTGDGARPAGDGDREAALAAKLGNPQLAADVARVLEQNPYAEIYVAEPDGTTRKITAADALAEAQEDARAAVELDACIGGATDEVPF